MTIVADLGNARLKWARVAGETLTDRGQSLHADAPDAALAAFSAALADGEQVVAVNVAGDGLGAGLRALVAQRAGELRFVVPTAEQYGVRCAYRDSSRLGADRWVAVVAAHHLIDGPACVIDAGTTVTLDAVTRDGEHLGGLILAGPEIVARALSRETRGVGDTVPAASVAAGLALLGKSTNDAVAHAAMLGTAAALDRAIVEVGAALDEPPTIVLTGGGAAVLEPWLATAVSYRPEFVLEGLAYIASAL